MRKILLGLVILSLALMTYICITENPKPGIVPGEKAQAAYDDISSNMAELYNSRPSSFSVNGEKIDGEKYVPKLDEKLKVMISLDLAKDKLSCDVETYDNGTVVINRGKFSVRILSEERPETENQIYLDSICEGLGFSYEANIRENAIDITAPEVEIELPASYDMRKEGKVSEVRNQGYNGTCWAFAALSALEALNMPEEKLQFSVDHMTLNNGFNIDTSAGGQYKISIAYLAAWEGPVLEKDDPYDDGETNADLKAVKHLQEAQIIQNKDFDEVKKAVMKYGGVESVIYCDMQNAHSNSEYYNQEKASYYYNGTESINHDVVIVGWDDNYSKKNFNIEPKADGAFICKNSWGEEFGEKGYFYVSYEDVTICSNCVVYTRLDDADNYDHIYQTDKLGWAGVLGYEESSAFFANAYTAKKGEELCAVAFYATDVKSTYEIYLVDEFSGVDDFSNMKLLKSGELKNAGYYTIDLDQTVTLKDDTKYAVVVKINTPGSKLPIAVEYDADEATENFDISDGEGYISLSGKGWYSAEKDRGCNVCLKAFTRDVK